MDAAIDNEPGRHPEAVISYGYWKRRFDLDPRVIGRAVRVRVVSTQLCGMNHGHEQLRRSLQALVRQCCFRAARLSARFWPLAQKPQLSRSQSAPLGVSESSLTTPLLPFNFNAETTGVGQIPCEQATRNYLPSQTFALDSIRASIRPRCLRSLGFIPWHWKRQSILNH